MAATDVQALIAELDEWVTARGRPPRTVSYGPDAEHEADLLLPADQPRGVAVLLHGGFWRARFKRSLMAAIAIDLAARGWASWNVEYRRVGNGGGGDRTLADIGRAIDALVALGEPGATPVDPGATLRKPGATLGEARAPTDMILIGHSAGGQLALCAAGRPAVGAVVSLAGVCDMVSAAKQAIGDNAVVEFLGATPREDPALYERTDPIQQLPTHKPVLLVHGDADDRVPVGLSRDYFAAAAAAGDGCELLELAGVDHFAVIDPRTATWAEIADRLPALLR